MQDCIILQEAIECMRGSQKLWTLFSTTSYSALPQSARCVDGFRSFLQTERPNGALDLESVFYEAHNEHSLCRSRFIESGGFDKLDSVPGAVEAMQWLRSCGIRLEALAWRPRSVREATKTSLKWLFPSSTFEDVHFVDAGDKGRVCRLIGALALVDDQVQNAMNAAKFGHCPF